MKKIASFFLLFPPFLTACNNADHSASSTPKDSSSPLSSTASLSFTVVDSFPHDTTFYTEGLEFHDGQLYESSGCGGSDDENEPGPFPSAFGVANLKSGKVDVRVVIDKKKYFGEGITFFGNKVYQLTYKSRKGFVYDAKTFKKIGEFEIPSKEGWGLTHDSTHLIMSDGSSTLYFLNPDSLTVDREITVADQDNALPNVNELEYVNGVIYANQYETNYIYKINPQTGAVLGRMDLSALSKEAHAKYPYGDVLNGIAYNQATGNLYVTGKNWPTIYEIKVQ